MTRRLTRTLTRWGIVLLLVLLYALAVGPMDMVR